LDQRVALYHFSVHKEYVTTFLARMRTQIRHASQEQAPPREGDPAAEAQWLERKASEQAQDARRQARRARKTAREHSREARQEERLDCYQHILTLKAQGLSSYEIAPRVGLSARTVHQWLADGVNTQKRRRRPSPLDVYAPYLRKRWGEGEQRGVRLYQELQKQGYTGSERAVHRYLGRWRSPRTDEDDPRPRNHRPRKTAPPPGPFDECQAKQAVWLYMRTPEKLTAIENEQLAFLNGVHPSLETAYDLVQAFLDMVHNRTGEKLDAWLSQVRASQIPELIRFVKGIERDKAPVQAALTRPESNGVVEGHVHRLKLIKRRGYGRASFSLLRRRVLSHAS